MDWILSPYIYLSHHLCLPAPVVVVWGSFHRNRLFAVTREIHYCAPSCAVSGDRRLYAALLQWRSLLKVARSVYFGPPLSACYTPLTVSCDRIIFSAIALTDIVLLPVLYKSAVAVFWLMSAVVAGQPIYSSTNVVPVAACCALLATHSSIGRPYTQSPCVGVTKCRSISSVHGPVHSLRYSVRPSAGGASLSSAFPSASILLLLPELQQ
jgi:hypothetical protein